jgi:RNA polymerase sigma-70 factor, ECF subfamily
MEPPVRPYHPNSSGERAARGGRPAKRQAGAPSRKTSDGSSGARSRGRRSSGGLARTEKPTQSGCGAPATHTVERASATETVTPDDAGLAIAALEPPADASEEASVGADAVEGAGAGPVVGIDDFEDIFTRFQTPITNFVFRLVGNREQAYDLAQDVFVKAYRALAGGATIQAGALSSWLYRIASNTATDALRRKRLISWLPLSLFNDDRGVGAGIPGSDSGFGMPTPTDEHLASAMGAFTASYDGGRFEQRVADREIVERVLKRLPEKYAACLLLYEHEGFSCAEIADVLNVTPSAVKMRLMRARERFISLYQQELEGHH